MKTKFFIFTLLLFNLSVFSQSANFNWVRQDSTRYDQRSANIKTITDYQNNLYTVGYFYGEIFFDSNTSLIGGGYGESYSYIKKTDSYGNLLWAKLIGEGGDNYVSDILETNENGNNYLYISGFFHGTVDFDNSINTHSYTTDDYYFAGFLLKLDSNGNFIWVKIFDNPQKEDFVFSIDSDSQNNIIVTGFTDSLNYPFLFDTNYEFDGFFSKLLISKIDINGNIVWNFDTPYNNGMVAGISVKTDSQNNVIVSGTFNHQVSFGLSNNFITHGNQYSTDIFILKLDENSNYIWAKQVGGLYNDGASQMVLDSNNDIYIRGFFKDTVDFDPDTNNSFILYGGGSGNADSDTYLLKLDNDGNFQWVNHFPRMTCNAITYNNNKIIVSVINYLNINHFINTFYNTIQLPYDNSGYYQHYILDFNIDGHFNNFVHLITGTGVTQDSQLTVKDINFNNNSLLLTGFFLYSINFGDNHILNSYGNFSNFVLSLHYDTNSIQTIDNHSINIYPNPVMENLYVSNNSNETFTTTEIYDILGKLISSKTNIENNINVSNLPNGFYILKLSNDKTSITKKFIVKH